MDCCPTTNAKAGRHPGPNRIDPTRTTTLRRSFSQEVARKFARFRALVVKFIDGDNNAALSANARHDFASTQFDVTDEDVRAKLRRLRESVAPDDVLEFPSIDHITVRYGLHPTPDTPLKVAALGAMSGPIVARIGHLGVFQTPDADVLKFDIDSPQLVNLNRRLGFLPNTQTYEYHPHLTAAYLRPGTGAKYATNYTTLPGTILTFTNLKYTDPDEKAETSVINSQQWKFLASDEKLKAFRDWLKTQIDQVLLGASDEELWRRFVQAGFEKGAGRAYDDAAKGGFVGKVRDFYLGSKAEFLRSAFARPVAVEKVRLLASRSFSDLKGVTDAMSTVMVRTLADGMARGLSPREVGRSLAKDVDGIGRVRTQTIARTEIIRAHADGQLHALEHLGLDEVEAAVEWSTVGDARVCPACQPLSGVILKLSEAKGMLPRHPNCRCAWIPANVGEKKDAQSRGKGEIMKRIRESLAKGKGWTPNPISKDRPTENVIQTNAVPPISLPAAIQSVLYQLSWWMTANAFCPTGKGGGIDPTCGADDTEYVL